MFLKLYETFIIQFKNYYLKKLLNAALKAAWNAGNEIIEIYNTDFSFESKSDLSPLTAADIASHNAIKAIIGDLGYPLLSEEGKTIPFEDRSNWDTFWLIDPLDGTKEFIKRNGEFTVNIALIEKGQPILGVIYVPITKKMYYGTKEEGSFCFGIEENNDKDLSDYIDEAIKLPNFSDANNSYTIVASRTHSSPETEAFINQKSTIHGEVKLVSAGSSLKLCMIAEGKANVYPRLAPTMEWDTAAGHAIVNFAGGRVYRFDNNEDLLYNKENLLNPFFVAEIGAK